MKFAKNYWEDFVVQGVHLGKVLHVYEDYYNDEKTLLRDYGYIVKTNVRHINEYYCVAIDSRFTSSNDLTISLEKNVFEKLANSPFTRIVDYFVMARDILNVEDANAPTLQSHAQVSEDDDITCFTIHISHEGEIDDLNIACTKQYYLQ